MDDKAVHDLAVEVDVALPVGVEGVGEVFQIDHVRYRVLGEAQNRDRASGGGVASRAERHHLDGEVGKGRDVEEVPDLTAHRGGAADRPAKRGLIDDGPHARWIWPGEEPLAFHPHAYPPFDLGLSGVGMAELYHRAGVVLSLQQARDELHLVTADDAGALLQPEVRLEPVRHQVTVAVPPARYVRLAR